jgi:rod shape-determining protein MreC
VRRLLLVLLVVTSLVLVVDLARPQWTSPLVDLGAAALGPVQAVVQWPAGGAARARAERDEALMLLDRARSERDALAGRLRLQESAPATQELVLARVVGVSAGSAPVGAREVTIDRGEDDGVRADRSVVAAEGLVGRVVSTTATTADVALLGDPRVVPGVRVGGGGVLGALDARAAPGLPVRPFGALTLTVLGEAPVAVGDEVRTVGSPGAVPYVADVLVGRVTAVDPEDGRLGSTAEVTPLAPLDRLDHVGVVVPEGPP